MVYEHLMIWIFPSTNFKLFECVYRLKYVTVFKRKKLQMNLPVELKESAWFTFVVGPELQTYFFLNPTSPFGIVPTTQSQISLRYTPSEMN